MIRMGFLKFSILTIVGAAIWCWVLAVLGQKVGAKLPASQMLALQKGDGVDLTHLIHAVKHEALWIVGVVVAICILYFVMQRLTGSKNS